MEEVKDGHGHAHGTHASDTEMIPKEALDKNIKKKKLDKEDLVQITCQWNKETREFSVPRHYSVKTFFSAVRKQYDAHVCIGELKFEDEDKDLITITKATDLVEFFSKERRKIYVIKQEHTHIRAKSAPDDFLNNVFTQLQDQDSKLNSSRKKSIGSDDENLRRPKPSVREGWVGAEISPFDLVIPEHIKPLGKGFFGEVRVGFLHGQQVACKILFGKSFKSNTESVLFIREISILSELRHPNIITYLGTCTEHNRKMIVMEYMSNGCLQDYLLTVVPTYDTLLKMVKDITVGMQFLHDHKILHRDLNSKNILLNGDMVAKVADFGLSKKLENSTLSYTTGQVTWMAPEVLEYSKNYTHKSDVYSFGILLWQMVSNGQPPCPNSLSYISMADKVLHEEWRPAIPNGVPNDWTKLIKYCWSQDPLCRPSFGDVVKITSIINLPLESCPPNLTVHAPPKQTQPQQPHHLKRDDDAMEAYEAYPYGL
eukprot:TRINITY_DN3270_c0_g1_i1.p1 TRINITY_DN3270_c0_g1~~TRINITY_DN3270_c0_g1_i1.p1  ORF type:complete len:557 (-),score=59.86 TRINITY_DN3270_c0_g1_i1:626-2077(-)